MRRLGNAKKINEDNIMDYTKLSDEELVELAKLGNKQCESFLISRYETNIIKLIKSKNLFLVGGEEQDLIQRGRLAVFYAINKYDKNHASGSKFSTFANICIKNKLFTAVKESKNDLLSKSDALNDLEIDEDKNFALADSRYDPAEQTINSEAEEELLSVIRLELSDFEFDVLRLKGLGYKNEKISEELKKDKKSIENALNRIKTKKSKFNSVINNK